MAANLKERYFGGPYASAFQDATNASTAMAREDFQQDQGKAIGGLAKIGGLRTGRAKTTLNDMSRTFGRQVGNIAASNAGELAKLEAGRAEGEANRGVDYARIASSDSQANARLGFDRERGARGDLESDREFGYKAGRDQTEDDYRRRRDTVGDSRYEDEKGYSRGRDTINDERYVDERQYDRGRDTRQDMESDREFGYRGERDRVGDQRYGDERDYSRGRDKVGDDRYVDERNYSRGRDQVGDARYTDETKWNRDTYMDERGYNRGRDREGDRKWEVERGDALAAQAQQNKKSFWDKAKGVVGMVATGYGIYKDVKRAVGKSDESASKSVYGGSGMGGIGEAWTDVKEGVGAAWGNAKTNYGKMKEDYDYAGKATQKALGGAKTDIVNAGGRLKNWAGDTKDRLFGHGPGSMAPPVDPDRQFDQARRDWDRQRNRDTLGGVTRPWQMPSGTPVPTGSVGGSSRTYNQPLAEGGRSWGGVPTGAPMGAGESFTMGGPGDMMTNTMGMEPRAGYGGVQMQGAPAGGGITPYADDRTMMTNGMGMVQRSGGAPVGYQKPRRDRAFGQRYM